jgi:hypothetical protein
MTVLTFDRSAFEPGYALRCTIGVALPLLTAAALGRPALGVPAAIGAFITGFTSLQGIYRTRLIAVLVAAVGMSITSFVGAIAAHSTPALVAATIIAGYAVGTLGQVSAVASTVALNSFVAFILFSSQPLTLPAAAQDSALVLTGGLIQATLILIAWPLSRRAAERIALADVYADLDCRRLAGTSADNAGCDGTPSLGRSAALCVGRRTRAPAAFAGRLGVDPSSSWGRRKRRAGAEVCGRGRGAACRGRATADRRAAGRCGRRNGR